MLQKRHPINSTINMVNYPETNYPHSQLTQEVIGIAIKVHREIGPGFREKYYQRAMYLELQKTKLKFEREKKVRIPYGNITLGYHIIDLMVENKVVVELKSMKNLTDIEKGQLTVYLKLTGCKVGLLLDFGAAILEIKRVKV